MLAIGVTEITHADVFTPTPNEQAIVNSLPAPKFRDYDATGPCQHNNDIFANMAAYNTWSDVKIKKIFLFWGMRHAGARAVASDLRCTDLVLIAKLWQSAVNSRITGKLTTSEAGGFAYSVNNLENRNLQQGLASNRQNQTSTPSTTGSNFSSAQSGNGIVAIRVNEIELGSSYDQVVSKLSTTLCHHEGNDIICSKESKCENQVQRPMTFEERMMTARNLNEALGHGDAARYNMGLQNCEAQFQASAKGRSELSFMGVPIEGARLSFNSGAYVSLRIRALNPMNVGRAASNNQSNHLEELKDVLTRQYGEPKIDSSYSTYTMPSYEYTPYEGWGHVARENVVTINEYTWRTQNLRIHLEKGIFQFDLLN